MLPLRSHRLFFLRSVFLLGICLVLVIASIQGSDGGAHAAPAGAVSPLSVLISEVAWAGTAASTDDEWIELYNPGTAAIDMTGWKLAADDAGLAIEISASTCIGGNCMIQPGGFFLLEHMDENAVQGVTANLLYGPPLAAINNIGTVLRLQAPDGAGWSDVDSANLGKAAGTGWYSGSGTPEFASMERVDKVADNAGAWVTNDGITVYGQDRSGTVLRATPGRLNSGWIQPATDTPTPTASNTPVAPGHLVISEFRSRGPNGVSDEFIEIYNASGGTTNIGGWYLQRSSGCGSSITKFYTFPNNTILVPGQYYLLKASGSSVGATDGTFTAGIADDGGVALFSNTSSTAVDMAGMCVSTQYREGSPLLPLTTNANQSYVRLPGGGMAGGCYDLNNNLGDFDLISPSDPQNSGSTVSMCVGQVAATFTHTPTFTPSKTPTATQTPTKTNTPAPGYPVINEILPHPRSDWNGDGVANYGDEYIEIINIGVREISIKSWVLRDALGTDVYTLPDITLEPREIARFFASETGISLSDGGDGVRLLNSSGKIMDAFDYLVVRAADRTWCRLPNGNGGWEFGCWPSPGRPNAMSPAGEATPVPVTDPCPLADTIPLSITSGECGSAGDGIWNPGTWENGEFWLSSRSKWDWFIE